MPDVNAGICFCSVAIETIVEVVRRVTKKWPEF